jgi:hypothetical protein
VETVRAAARASSPEEITTGPGDPDPKKGTYMKLGLVGYPQAGKRTILHALTGHEAGSNGDGSSGLGLARVWDARFEQLVRMYRPRRESPLYIEFTLLPDVKEQAARNISTLRELEQVDAVCFVARAFHEENVFHILGSVDPRRDLLRFQEELQLNDLLFIEKRLERLERERGKKVDARKAAMERDLLVRMKDHLEAGSLLRSLDLAEEERRLIGAYGLLSRKPVIVVLNVGEDQGGDAGLVERMEAEFAGQGYRFIAVSAKIEQEISAIDPEERGAFMEALHIDRPALDRLTTLCYRTLGLVSFFTVGSDEVRAWAVRQGSPAPKAARVIHSDMARGFIRAEVMKYEDLSRLGHEQKLKAAGKLMQKGKDYVVEDGDIISFLFNV